MKKLSAIFLGVAIASSAFSAFAQTAPDTLIDAQMEKRLFMLSRTIEDDKIIIERGSSDDAASTVTERSISDRNSLNVSSTYKREWRFAENKVCLTHTEGQYGENGDFNVYVNLDGGCFAIPDNAYAQKMRQALTVR
jgi:hypothetical protein